MTIFVGSTNPVKINAVKSAISAGTINAEVIGIEVESGVSSQPRTDKETRAGALNRAKNVLKVGQTKFPDTTKPQLGIGLEGGIFSPLPNEAWSTVWACVADAMGNTFESNGARFKLPPKIAEPILDGKEMGPVVGRLFSDPNIKQKQGAIGVVTKGFVDRTTEYAIIVQLAIGLWYGQDWETQIPQA